MPLIKPRQSPLRKASFEIDLAVQSLSAMCRDAAAPIVLFIGRPRDTTGTPVTVVFRKFLISLARPIRFERPTFAFGQNPIQLGIFGTLLLSGRSALRSGDHRFYGAECRVLWADSTALVRS